jgi:hypothetical protein
MKRSFLRSVLGDEASTMIARQHFRLFKSRKTFPLINGQTLLRLGEAMRGRVEFNESICNAGLIPIVGGYTCVAKNQRFNYGNEIGIGDDSGVKDSDDGLRILYRIDLDANWNTKSVQKLRVSLDGRPVDPVVFIEDVRLMVYHSNIIACANGYNKDGAWPLIGTLGKDAISLRSVVGKFSAPQKNWMPFTYNNRLFFEYSIQPHVILSCDLDSSECGEAYCTIMESNAFPEHLHGGAPPLRLNERYFLGVGNSQHLYWFQDRYYAAVFYLFEAKPPFHVVKVSSPVRVQSRAERIQYICGLAFGEDKQSLVLSIGICDCDNRFALVSLDQVLALFQDQHVSTSRH